MKIDLSIIVVHLITTAALAAHGLGCSCRPRMTEQEVEALRHGMTQEMERQHMASQRREQVWEETERSFDTDQDGSLNATEKANFDNYLNRIKQGQVPNPFLEDGAAGKR